MRKSIIPSVFSVKAGLRAVNVTCRKAMGKLEGNPEQQLMQSSAEVKGCEVTPVCEQVIKTYIGVPACRGQIRVA